MWRVYGVRERNEARWGGPRTNLCASIFEANMRSPSPRRPTSTRAEVEQTAA
jgi:hypothetical protein